MAKGMSKFNESGGSGNRREVEVSQMMDEINETETTEETTNEFDHRTDEDKNAEGISEIIKEWKGDKQTESESDESSTKDTESDDNKPASEGETKDGAVEEKKADDELSVIPKILIDKALELGVTESEVQAVKSINELSTLIDVLNKGEAAPKEAEKEIEPEVDFDELKLNPDDYEEELVEKFDKVVDLLKDSTEKNKKLIETEMQRQAGMRADAELQIIDNFDKTLDGLDEDLFGKFETNEPKSDTYNNRSNMWEEVKKLGSVYQDASMEQLVELAGIKTFGDKFNKKSVKEAETSKKLEERSKSLLGKPSQREIVDAELPDGKANAVSAVAAKLKEWGFKK